VNDPTEAERAPAATKDDGTRPTGRPEGVAPPGGGERSSLRGDDIVRAPASRGGLVAAGVALALAVAIGLAWIDGQRDVAALRAEAAEKLSILQSNATQARERETQLAVDLRDAQAKVALLEARIAESQSQQSALEQLYRDLAPSHDELALAEVEQALALASRELTIAANVPAALGALQLADTKLARLDRPRFGPLRRAIAADMERLKAVPFVDAAALAGKLDSAISSVDTLPLARDERVLPPPVPAPALDGASWSRALASLWADLKGLVRVQVDDRAAPPLLAPGQQYFLRENLRLRLVSARIALIARNESALRADVKAADTWLRQYFDMKATPVQALSATLVALGAVAMPADVPDVTRSLDAARALRVAQDARGGAPR